MRSNVRLSVVVLCLAAGLVLGAVTVAGAGELPQRVVIHVDSMKQARELGKIVDVDREASRFGEGEIVAYASAKALLTLTKMGIDWQIAPEPKDTKALTMCSSGWENNPTWDCYPTYAQYEAIMQKWATDFPSICREVEIGTSQNNHKLLALKITDNPDTAEDEPEVFYTSTMHGDETAGYVFMLRLIDELLSGYGTDTELTDMVDSMEIWINPLANPDGTYYGGDTSVSSARRSLADGRDPNRDFPDPESDPNDTPSGRAQETVAMMNFAHAHHFVISANFHGGAEVVNYPWDTWSRRHPDDTWWQSISRDYADQAQADGPSGYMDELDNGITNGYDWYEVDGGRQDYMNYWNHCRELTIELSDTKLLGTENLGTYYTANRQALLDYLKNALEGVRGIVTDAVTGDPLDATITVLNHDADNSEVVTDPAVGDYHRMIAPGTWTLRFSATGYIPQDHSVTVTAGGTVRLDVQLGEAQQVTVSGRVVTPDTTRASGISGATVEIVETGDQATTGTDGTYSIPNVYEGTYTFRVSASGYETLEQSRDVAASAQQDFSLAPLTTPFETDLEPDDGGLSGGGGWAWGAPSGSGNPGAHSGSNVWATVLSGDYSSSADWNLDLNVAVPAGNPALTFWHWYAMESGYDGGQVRISTDSGSTWTVLTPDGGYPASNVNALSGPGYNGNSGGWIQARFGLSAYAGQNVRLRWHFASDGSVQDLGWYVDDIAVVAATYQADFDAEPTSVAPGQAVQFHDLSSGPVQSWAWNFGDGSTSTERNPSHAYSAAGAYTVTLTTSWAGGATDTKTRTDYIQVGGGCMPSFAGATSAQQAANVHFAAVDVAWSAASDDCNTGSMTYELWVWGPGDTVDWNDTPYRTGITGTSFRVTGLAASATYTFGVRARDGAGNTDDNTVTVQATTTGRASGETDQACAGGSANVTVSDLLHIVGVIFGASECENPGWPVSDVDGDGTVHAPDLSTEIRYLTGGIY